MALNYELEAIDDWKSLNSGTTQCVCFVAMFCGMPIIAAKGKDGWREVAKRAHMWETVYGPIASNGEPIAPEVFRRYIGLRTNASRLTEAQFGKRLTEKLRENAKARAASIADLAAPEAGQ